MKFKFNPLTGEFNLVPDSGTLKQKLNWLTGNFNLTKDAGKYKQIYNVIEGEFNLRPAVTQVIVHGVGSIQLTNAVENGLLSLKAYGGTEQDLTPTPTTPVDIVSNNGVLRVRHQSGLPIGYTLLDYIKSGGNNYIDTGIKLTNEDVVEIQYLQTADKGAIYGEYYNGTSNMSTTLYGNGKFYFYAYNAGGTATNVGTYDTNVHTVVHNFVDGYIDFDGVRTNFDLPNPNSFTNILNCPIFGRSNSSSIGYFSKTQLYYFRIRRNGTLILDLIPAKDSNDTVGMYDKVSGTLFTESGTGSFVAGNTVADPMTVYADGTTETINVHTRNLFNKNDSSTLFDGYLNNTLAEQNTVLNAYGGGDKTIIIKVNPNTTYTVTRATYLGRSYDRIRCAAFTEKPVNNSIGVMLCNVISKSQASATFTTLSDTEYVAINVRNSGTAGNDWTQYIDAFQLEEGETATPYQPYFEGSTATAEMLLKIGTYQDEQEILSGNIIRKVGALVLDGVTAGRKLSSTWNATYKRGNISIPTIKQTSYLIADCVCTHFPYSTSTQGAPTSPGFCSREQDKVVLFAFAGMDNINSSSDANAFLTDQYNAGTPVIVLYPLDEETTETVTEQPLTIPAGDSTIEITQASLDNLELEATYEQEG